MRLTQYTDYALRTLMYLANLPEGDLSSIQEITTAYNISNNHLVKVVHQLGKLGYVETLRGRGGGIRLAQAPQEINIGQLVRQTEEDFYLVECFNAEKNHCFITPECQLRSVFAEAMQAFLAVLDSYTLADIARNQLLAQHIIQIEPARRKPASSQADVV
ncbi:Rrf2 family transcriptional regulator [Dictyobacter aurantiacus]|uniref:HTH-type transcriptional regulator NsrR n=1 Tax=Dictyobacter aurantiacus TaxID=1936993 RepID=A0A401ZQ83_9CHLR|nr:Rrf2 family transcriptional regulator [Dictyobacter aurantiacus]GCE08970.1 HTH-type transcriptional regulator NsrR [Dictyobacter aurantiacus]